ncbi:hypothetical protein SUDANB121_01043 [Nocardiopsis dassonvillei]|uniref:hypothetical protein n=1 Tax=Nocardiopsis dassonvillei TaxID=2014 RepID=UPI003F5762C4
MSLPLARRAALALVLPLALLAESAPAWAEPDRRTEPVWEYVGSYSDLFAARGDCDRAGREGVEAGEWTAYRCTPLIVGPPNIRMLYVLR